MHFLALTSVGQISILTLSYLRSLFPIVYLFKFLKHFYFLPFWLHAMSILNFWNGTNYEVPHCGAFSTPHSHPNICLRILFSNTLSLDSSLNVRDHASQPYSTTGNIIVLYYWRAFVNAALNLRVL